MERQYLSNLDMFVCTYQVVITKLKIKHFELINMIEPAGFVKALNCNFGHKTAPGMESLIKYPILKKRTNLRKIRKGEGDKTCFNSALEATVFIEDPPGLVKQIQSIRDKKKYFLKYFPTTGQIQIPGIILTSFRDGQYLASKWVEYLNNQLRPSEPITIVSQNPIMLNYKFKLKDSTGVLDFQEIIKYFKKHECPGFVIREIINNDCLKLSTKFMIENRKYRIKIFPTGKINLLGVKEPLHAYNIYNYMEHMFQTSADQIIVTPPEPDQIIS
nr:hypothetical protein [Abalone asfa-like virus]